VLKITSLALGFDSQGLCHVRGKFEGQLNKSGEIFTYKIQMVTEKACGPEIPGREVPVGMGEDVQNPAIKLGKVLPQVEEK
jgi:hypothetical protein